MFMAPIVHFDNYVKKNIRMSFDLYTFLEKVTFQSLKMRVSQWSITLSSSDGNPPGKTDGKPSRSRAGVIGCTRGS